MKRKSTLLLCILVISVLAFAFSSQTACVSGEFASGWSKVYGGSSDDEAYSVVQTSDGGYAIAGYTESFGAGGSDFWLVKTDANGIMQWNKTYGGTGNDEARSLVATPDGGYGMAGRTESFGAGGYDFWLVKVDSSGNTQWNQTYGGPDNDYPSCIVQASDGGYAIAGVFSAAGGPSDESDAWLIKVDSSGNMQWNKTFGGDIQSLVATSDGGYTIAGASESWCSLVIKTDAFGNMQWNKTYGEYTDLHFSLVVTPDGGYAVAGAVNHVEESDFWLVKTDSLGNMQWNKTYGETGYNVAASVVTTSDGGYAMVGEHGAGRYSDLQLVKVDSYGNMQWEKIVDRLEIQIEDYARCLITTTDGGYSIAGSSNSGNSMDFWLLKTDGNGVVPELPFSLALLALTVSTIVIVALVKARWKGAFKT